ncbi:MAG: hypothetical protein J6B02_02710 [Selenomonadales bacterium]|nr:hypothetical protein [Selenomonadales bacterium]
MTLTLEELIQNRNDLIEAHRKNNFTDGIHALLTDLYPDTAHFIYELLQNAEDMNASTVRFALYDNRIDFEHNGTKRAFNIADIDAITNIGHNSQKKDDPTSIGKFGVGFKAVFAYTATPIIHSGEYHFKIKDYFVPSFQDVPKADTVDGNGVAWTKFSFPFNNPKKSSAVAFKECCDGLNSLDSSSILFLQNIRKIEYRIAPDKQGYVERINNKSHHISVKYQKPIHSKELVSRWLRFHRLISITDEQGKNKTLPISAAFSLEYDEQTKKDKIVPIKTGGRTFIYFPAEKEYSGLRFHINAPFASTVARDSVRSCSDNIKLITALSQLIVDSLPEIKAQGMMNHSFFEALPNRKDNLSYFYAHILEHIQEAFFKNKYLPTKYNAFVSSQNALIGPVAISNLLNVVDLKTLTGIDKIWISNAAQKHSLADNFIQSLDIQQYTYSDFVTIFEPPSRAKVEKFLSYKSIEWLKGFYLLCFDAYDDLSFYNRYSFNKTASNKAHFANSLKQSAIIKSTTGRMYRPEDIFILPIDTQTITKNTPIVNQTLFISNTKLDRATARIKLFFKNILDIADYGPKIETEKLLKKYTSSFELNDNYFKDLLSFAKYAETHKDINFSSYPLFFYLNKSDNTLHNTKANELFLGKQYRNSIGETLADAYEKNCLWNGYAEHYGEKDLQSIISFTVLCGVKKGLSIEPQSARLHPLYETKLISLRRDTSLGVNSDYIIPELKKLLDLRSIEINKLIWETLLQYGKLSNATKYLTAQYSPNGSTKIKTCSSSLIYYLSQIPWIPDKKGVLHNPNTISVSDLPENLSFDPENKLLTALKIGTDLERQSNLEKDAKEAGLRLLPEEEYQEYLFLKKQKERKEAIARLSSQELLDKQTKHSTPHINANDDFSTDGAVRNPQRREASIESKYHNAKQQDPARRKLFSQLVESTESERRQLRNWYQGYCQMCNTRIMAHNQQPYFIAKNIIDSRYLSDSVRQTNELAWNSLCLCPNCAAKYQVCSRDINGLYDQIINTDVIAGDTEDIILTIELADKQQPIRYIPKHFLTLKTVIKLIDEDTKK